MNRLVSSSIVMSSALLLACGGKSSGSKAPTASGDPCAAGIHASGVTARAATWEAVAVAADAGDDGVCVFSPCGPEEGVSFVGGTALAVKVDGGHTVIPDAWDGLNGAPPIEVEDLGGLLHVSLTMELLGREDVELDDGEQTTATVSLGWSYADFVVDRASGKVLWQAYCQADEGVAGRTPEVTRDGSTFGYTSCLPTTPAVTFTAEQAAACPAK